MTTVDIRFLVESQASVDQTYLNLGHFLKLQPLFAGGTGFHRKYSAFSEGLTT